MELTLAAFQADVTPPLGSALCHGNCVPAVRIVHPLTARGIILTGDGPPVVLCAVDWVGIANRSHDTWRDALADAAGTDRDHVAVHTLHPHDAPGTDAGAEALLAQHGLPDALFPTTFGAEAVCRAAAACRAAVQRPRRVTHLAMGKATVRKFASNRRPLGPDGKVSHVRYSACRSEPVRALDEGVIDPFVRSLAFWENDVPVASLTFYATHPQSFYNRGAVSPDTVGLARSLRESTVPEAAHVHFLGAGGNVAAGKYNDGSPGNRFRLALRLAHGMEEAWATAVKVPIESADMAWRHQTVRLPIAPLLLENEAENARMLQDATRPAADRVRAARHLHYTRLWKDGRSVQVACLRLGPAFVLIMPGELFVEYQLAAQAMRPHEMVCMAAYGDYGPSYIGTAEAYAQGGYECSPRIAKVAPEVEGVLMDAMRSLLS